MFEVFEHTADVGLRIRGRSLSELLIDAARGFFSLIVVNLDAVRPVQETKYQLEWTEPDPKQACPAAVLAH